MTTYKSIAIRLSQLFDENDTLHQATITKCLDRIQELEYRLKVSEAKLSQTKRLLASSEQQRIQALSLLDTNQYRNQ